jgi:Tfp pilus assembly protein PilF
MLSCGAGQYLLAAAKVDEALMNTLACRNLSFAALLLSAAVAAQPLDLDDLESRIEYGWFTEDANSLRNLIRSTTADLSKDGDSTLLRYEIGLANYRLGVLLMEKSSAEAAAALADCVDELDAALETDQQSAEIYALQAACYASLAELQAWKAMAYAPLSSTRVEKANRLAPENPRVVLLDGLADRSLPKALGGDKVRAQKKFTRAVQLFEESGAQDPGGPRWGAADAYLHLGRGLHQSGDTLGARNALEQALIIAPEFAAARRELRQLTSGSR